MVPRKVWGCWYNCQLCILVPRQLFPCGMNFLHKISVLFLLKWAFPIKCLGVHLKSCAKRAGITKLWHCGMILLLAISMLSTYLRIAAGSLCKKLLLDLFIKSLYGISNKWVASFLPILVQMRVPYGENLRGITHFPLLDMSKSLVTIYLLLSPEHVLWTMEIVLGTELPSKDFGNID